VPDIVPTLAPRADWPSKVIDLTAKSMLGSHGSVAERSNFVEKSIDAVSTNLEFLHGYKCCLVYASQHESS